MTNPIKRFFQILKDMVLFPMRMLQVRRSYQDLEKIRQLPKNPEERMKILAKMGLIDDMSPMIDPFLYQQRKERPLYEVDLSYLDEEEEIDEGDQED